MQGRIGREGGREGRGEGGREVEGSTTRDRGLQPALKLEASSSSSSSDRYTRRLSAAV